MEFAREIAQLNGLRILIHTQATNARAAFRRDFDETESPLFARFGIEQDLTQVGDAAARADTAKNRPHPAPFKTDGVATEASCLAPEQGLAGSAVARDLLHWLPPEGTHISGELPNLAIRG